MDATQFLKVVIVLTTVAASVAYLTLPQHKVVRPDARFLASEHIQDMEAYILSETEIRPCTLTASGDILRCSDLDWNYVGTVNKDMGGRNVECIWAHPTANKTLVIKFRDIGLTDEINGIYGILDEADTKDPGTVNFRVNVQGADIFGGEVVYPGADKFNIKTTPGKNDIEFRIYTENDKKRHFCFNAWS